MLTVIDYKVVVNYRQPDLLKVHNLCLKSSVVVVVFVPLGKLGLELCTLYELSLSIACVKPLPPLPSPMRSRTRSPIWYGVNVASSPCQWETRVHRRDLDVLLNPLFTGPSVP